MFKSIFDKFFCIIKKFIFSILIIYAYNVIFFPMENLIPMNLFTISMIFLLGFPGIIGFELFSLLIL